MYKKFNPYNLSLFTNVQKDTIIVFCSSIILAFSILSVWGGIAVLLFAIILMILTIPIVYYFEKLICLRGLVLGFILAITYKTIFLLVKIVILNEKPNNALIINDAAGYIASAFNTNITELILDYGVDLGYVFFLQFLVKTFNILINDVPIIFVLPNIFASSLIVVFTLALASKVIPYIHPSYVFWIAALDPMMANYSTVALKDSLVATFVSVSFIIFISRKNHIKQIIIWGISIFGSFVLRFRSLLITAGLIGTRIFFSKNIKNIKKRQFISFIFIFILSFSFISNGPNLLTLFNRGKSIIDTEQAHVDKIAMKGKLDSRSSGRLGLIINSMPSLPLRVSARTLMSFLAPIPPMQFYQFNWGSGVDDIQARLFRDLGGLFWYLMMPFLLLGTVFFLKQKEYFIPTALFIVLLAMGLGGWVDARIRLMASLPSYILISTGLANNNFNNKYSVAFYLLLLFFWILYELIF